MAKRQLPVMEQQSYDGRHFIDAKAVTVGDFVPRRLWKKHRVATGVTIGMEVEGGVVKWTTLENPEQVDQLIQSLLRHKRRVWPEAP